MGLNRTASWSTNSDGTPAKERGSTIHDVSNKSLWDSVKQRETVSRRALKREGCALILFGVF